MKINKLFLLISFVIIFVSNRDNAQINIGGKPYSFTHSVVKSDGVKNMPQIDVESLLMEDETTTKDLPFRFGYGFDVNYSCVTTWHLGDNLTNRLASHNGNLLCNATHY
ncbi:MAG: hypothetical protein ABIG69_01005 [Bacteroidota bacterium]|nr:hypothetical protein [Bacteroidota bacterium]